MEVTSHKGSHVPPLIVQELWSILLSRESKIMMCRGIDLREWDHRQWTLPTKLLFSLCCATQLERICCCCFYNDTPDGDDSLRWVWSSIFMFFLGCFDYIIGSSGFSTVYFCIIVECVVREGGFVHTKLAGSGPQASLSLSFVPGEKEFKRFLPVDCWRIYRRVAGYHRLREMSISNDPSTC